MTLPVKLLPAAKRDLNKILAYIQERSAQGANAWFARWKNALNSLARMPAIHGLAPESDEGDREIRQLLFKTRRGLTYRALFIIRDRDVVVLRIRGPGQNLLAYDDLGIPDE